jgi:predicted HTH transcriptional regulator
MNLIDLLKFIRENGPVRAIDLCNRFNIEWNEMSDGLTSLKKDGVLQRGAMYLPSGGNRPTLCIGWSCKTD